MVNYNVKYCIGGNDDDDDDDDDDVVDNDGYHDSDNNNHAKRFIHRMHLCPQMHVIDLFRLYIYFSQYR